jgi:hypothetical protein
MVAVRDRFDEPLSQDTLFEWHRLVMAGNTYITQGQWRAPAEPMEIISGAVGKEKVHYQAPPSSRIPREMKRFIRWFNDTAPGGRKPMSKGSVRSALAHLYFESVHPFEEVEAYKVPNLDSLPGTEELVQAILNDEFTTETKPWSYWEAFRLTNGVTGEERKIGQEFRSSIKRCKIEA